MTPDGYLDHAATAVPKAPGVAEAVTRCLEGGAGSPGRGGHRLAVAATRVVEEARDAVASLLGGEPERTLFGSGCTALLNTVLASRLRPGDRVVTSALEHNAVMRPLRALSDRRRVEVRVVRGAAVTGVPTALEIADAVREAPTRLVVLVHASNVTGAILPVAEVAAAVAPVPVAVDGAQFGGSAPLRFSELGVAAWTCSGHKGLLGPPGTGVLLLAPGFEVEPLALGGTGSRSESELMPEALPDRLEAGTPNVAGVAGLGAACRWLAGAGIATLGRRAIDLAAAATRELAAVPGVHLPGYVESDDRVALFSFTVDGLDTGELAAWLDREHGLMLRAGLHCAPAAHRRLATFPGGTLRVGIGPFTPERTLERLVEAVRAAPRALARRAEGR